MKTFFSIVGVLVIGLLLTIAIWSTHDAPDPFAAPAKKSIPVESDQTARYRKACANEKYLADRRKFADFTTQDLKVIQACKQLGFWD
jgi:hypothetical protein